LVLEVTIQFGCVGEEDQNNQGNDQRLDVLLGHALDTHFIVELVILDLLALAIIVTLGIIHLHPIAVVEVDGHA